MSVLEMMVELEMASDDEIKAKWNTPAKYVKRVLKKLLLQELLDEEKEEKDEETPTVPGEEPKVKRTRRTKEQIEADRAEGKD